MSASKDQAMSKLFWALVDKNPKQHVVDFFANKLFTSPPAPGPLVPPTSVATSQATPAASVGFTPYQAADVYSRALVEDDESDEEDDDVPINDTPDLPAKDVRVMVSAACNLCSLEQLLWRDISTKKQYNLAVIWCIVDEQGMVFL